MPSTSILTRAPLLRAALFALAAPLLAIGCTDPTASDDDTSDPYDSDDDWENDDPCADTPLVLSFDNAPVEYLPYVDDAYFDIGQHDEDVTTHWPTARTPWLARDVDGNGSIDDGSELFGSETTLASGAKAFDGFVALAELDLDGDGRVDRAELAQGGVVVWRDEDGDRASTPAELTSPLSEGLLWIDLPNADTQAPRGPLCDGNGNCEIARSGFGFVDAKGVEQSGTVIDINLAYLPHPNAEEPSDDDWEDDWEDDDWGDCF